MTEIHDLTAADLVRLYRRRELSPVEVTRDTLARIERFNPVINAFIVIIGDAALAAARESETRWQKGEPRGLVDGVPATIKDNVWVAGLPCRKGSATTDASPVAEDAPAVARLREQGAVIVGKTTLPEFGWIGACHSPLTGITRNPWNLDRTPGGSSGGAAAAALLNLGWLHIGTDGAGSIRIPAAFTGVFGIKPSYGRVPAYPASPFAALAHLGPLTRTVTDAATMLSVISGPDERDMTAWNTPRAGFSRRPRRGRQGPAHRLEPAPRLCHPHRSGGRRPQRQPRRASSRISARMSSRPIPISPRRSMPSARSGARCRRRSSTAFRRASTARWIPASCAWPTAAGAIRSPISCRPTSRAPSSPTRWSRFHQRYDLLLTPQMADPGAGGRAGSARERRLRRELGGLVALHLSVQSDATAGRLRAVRLHVRRVADRPADRRPGPRRRAGAARGARLRERPAVRHALVATQYSGNSCRRARSVFVTTRTRFAG